MNKIISGALSILIPYAIFTANLDVAVKSLLVSIVCGVILAYYILKSGGWARLSSEGKILSVPTIALIIVAMFNVLLALEIGPIALWSMYFGANALAFIASARLGSQ